MFRNLLLHPNWLSSTCLLLQPPQEAYPEAAIVGGVVMGRRVVAKRGGAVSHGRGVGALAISGNAPLFAMTCLDRNGGDQCQEY